MKKFSGIKLKRLMEEKKINQITLAERLELTQQAISSWINEKTTPEYDKFIELIKILDVSEENLMEDTGANIYAAGYNQGGIHLYNHYPTININNSSQVEMLFLDAKVQNPITIGLKIDNSALPKIINNAKKQNKTVGQYVADLITDIGSL